MKRQLQTLLWLVSYNIESLVYKLKLQRHSVRNTPPETTQIKSFAETLYL